MAADQWRSLPFNQAVEINPSVPLERGQVYPFVDMQAVDPSARTVAPSAYRQFTGGGSRFAAGDTLMARITPCLENGKIARFRGGTREIIGHGSTEFIVIRGRDGVTENDFAYYLTRSDAVRGFAISQMTGTSGRQRVPTDSLAHIEVPVPPLDEQRAIAQILGTLDDKIELNRRMNETLEGIARALFKSWFVDFDPVRAKAEDRDPGLPRQLADLFPDSFEDSERGEIPAGWHVVTVADVAEINAQTLGRTDPLTVIDYIEISEVMRGEVGRVVRYERGAEPSRARRRLRHGDAVVSTVRPDRGAHFLCLHPPETLIASTGFAVLSSRDGNWAFLYSAVTHREVGEELGRLADGGAYPAVRPEVIGALNLVAPTEPSLLFVFQKIAGPFFELSAQNQTQSKTLAEIRDTLLPKLIYGELRVPDTERIIGKYV